MYRSLGEGRYRIEANARGILSKVFCDDEPLTNVTAIRLDVGIEDLTTLTLSVIPESVDVETVELRPVEHGIQPTDAQLMSAVGPIEVGSFSLKPDWRTIAVTAIASGLGGAFGATFVLHLAQIF